MEQTPSPAFHVPHADPKLAKIMHDAAPAYPLRMQRRDGVVRVEDDRNEQNVKFTSRALDQLVCAPKQENVKK